MNVILVDARRYGHVLKGARKTVRLDKKTMLQKCLVSVPKNYAVMNEWAELVLARLFTYGYMLMIARKNIKRKEQDS